MAHRSGGFGIELVCVRLVVSDLYEHERRLLGRKRGFVHVHEPTWEQVQIRREEYAHWVDDHVEKEYVMADGDVVEFRSNV